MRRYRRAWQVAAAIAVTATVIAGCSSNKSGGGNSTKPSSASTNGNGSDQSLAPAFNAATVGWVNKSDKKGGNLRLLQQDDCDSWDPAASYLGACWNLQRLYVRTLMGYSSIPGANNASKIEPDAASAPGASNADKTEWTYKLKSGIKWENGSPVTSKDFKYGLERLFATDVINGGAGFYYTSIINAPKGYAGPYKSGDLPDTAIATPDDQTIVIKLKSPFADMDYLMALSTSAAVPANVEGGANFKGDKYTLHPVSNGPYRISSYTPKKQITFVRNDQWDPSTDKIRQALADTITVTVNSDPDDSDKKIQANEADGLSDSTGIQATFQSQVVTNPDLKKNADDPVDASTRYLVLVPAVAPLDNIHCRLAVFYAVNKSDLRLARGGTYAGDIANTMDNPTVVGYDPTANPYPNGPDNTGDLAKAKDELTQCGKPDGFNLKMAYVNAGKGSKVFVATQAALKRVGINLISAPGDQATFYSKYIGSPANLKSQGLGIAQAGWGADFPTPYGFWNNIANGASILPTGNSNYASLNDPIVNQILDNGAKGQSTPDDWKKLDAQVMKDAVMLPYLHEKTLYYRNPRLTNLRSNFSVAFGAYDWVNVGTSDGK